MLSVVVPVDGLRVGDFVDFGERAVPPRFWCVSAIRDGEQRAISWVPALLGHPASPWAGRYAFGTPMRRVPEVVMKRLRG